MLACIVQRTALPGLGAWGLRSPFSSDKGKEYIVESDCAGGVGEDGHGRLFDSDSFVRLFFGIRP